MGNSITGYYADDRIAWQCTVSPAADIKSQSDDAVPSVSALLNGFFISSFAGDLSAFKSSYILQTAAVDGTLVATLTDSLGGRTQAQLAPAANAAAAWMLVGEVPVIPTVNAGFSVAAAGLRSAPTLQYWRDAMDSVMLYGAVALTSATPGSVIFTLGANYLPVAKMNLQQGTVMQQSSAGTFKGVAHWFISAGAVSVNMLITPAIGDILNFSERIALGNRPVAQ
jgi:hypothetical protein